MLALKQTYRYTALFMALFLLSWGIGNMIQASRTQPSVGDQFVAGLERMQASRAAEANSQTP